MHVYQTLFDIVSDLCFVRRRSDLHGRFPGEREREVERERERGREGEREREGEESEGGRGERGRE